MGAANSPELCLVVNLPCFRGLFPAPVVRGTLTRTARRTTALLRPFSGYGSISRYPRAGSNRRGPRKSPSSTVSCCFCRRGGPLCPPASQKARVCCRGTARRARQRSFVPVLQLPNRTTLSVNKRTNNLFFLFLTLESRYPEQDGKTCAPLVN